MAVKYKEYFFDTEEEANEDQNMKKGIQGYSESYAAGVIKCMTEDNKVVWKSSHKVYYG